MRLKHLMLLMKFKIHFIEIKFHHLCKELSVNKRNITTLLRYSTKLQHLSTPYITPSSSEPEAFHSQIKQQQPRPANRTARARPRESFSFFTAERRGISDPFGRGWALGLMKTVIEPRRRRESIGGAVSTLITAAIRERAEGRVA